MVVKTVRTDVVKWRFAKSAVAVALIVCVIARRSMNPTLLLAAATLLVAIATMFWWARRSLGRRELGVFGDRVHVGDDGTEIARHDVRAWTLDGDLARVYTSSAGWQFRAGNGETEALAQILGRAFGARLTIRRRGSSRSRRIAGGVAVIGAALAGIGIALGALPCVVVGTPAAIFGLAALGALSQKVANGRA